MIILLKDFKINIVPGTETKKYAVVGIDTKTQNEKKTI